MTTLALLLAAAGGVGPASAEPCGDIALEGVCEQSTLMYCNAEELLVTKCPSCCGWKGTRYACQEACPAPGECFDECLDGPGVFGCSLLATHQWTCVENPETGCVERVFEKCAEDEICDEGITHKCMDKSRVDLCSGVPAAGICDAGKFKKCVDNHIELDDCAAKGQACVAGQGCTSQCPVDCLDGEAGCLPNGQAWVCTKSPVSGCWEKAAKTCAAGKMCHEGDCLYPSQVEPGDAEPAPGPDAGGLGEPAAEAPAAKEDASNGGCVSGTRAPGGSAETTFAVLLLMLLSCGRARRNGRIEE